MSGAGRWWDSGARAWEPAVETDDGWLVGYHGARAVAAAIYAPAALIDLEAPCEAAPLEEWCWESGRFEVTGDVPKWCFRRPIRDAKPTSALTTAPAIRASGWLADCSQFGIPARV